MLAIGDRIPEFDLITDRGERVTPQTLRGSRTVLYFYPKDDTPGCTKEACGFRDAMAAFDAAKVRVYGISADDVQSHGKFVAKHGLNFPLIADPERQAIEGFGVWVEKSMYGRRYMGIARATFVIDAEGRIEKVWDKVKPETHAAEVLAWLTGAAPKVEQPAAKRASTAKSSARSKPASKQVKATRDAAKTGPRRR